MFPASIYHFQSWGGIVLCFRLNCFTSCRTLSTVEMDLEKMFQIHLHGAFQNIFPSKLSMPHQDDICQLP